MLDWELSTIGHPMADVATLCASYDVPFMENAPSGGFSGLAGLDLESWGVPSEEALRAMYADRVNAPRDDPFASFHTAFHRFKGAVIAQGIGARLAKGVNSSDMASSFAALTPLLAEQVVGHLDDLQARLGRPIASARAVGGAKARDDYAHSEASVEGMCVCFGLQGGLRGWLVVQGDAAKRHAMAALWLAMPSGEQHVAAMYALLVF